VRTPSLRDAVNDEADGVRSANSWTDHPRYVSASRRPGLAAPRGADNTDGTDPIKLLPALWIAAGLERA